jgi:hypothetical protein
VCVCVCVCVCDSVTVWQGFVVCKLRVSVFFFGATVHEVQPLTSSPALDSSASCLLVALAQLARTRERLFIWLAGWRCCLVSVWMTLSRVCVCVMRV